MSLEKGTQIFPYPQSICIVCKNSRYLNMNVNVDYFVCFEINSLNKNSLSCDSIKTTEINYFMLTYERITPRSSGL